MKPLAKKAIISIACLTPIALVCGFAVPYNHKQNIICTGSSSVKPIVETMANNFINENPSLSYDVTCEGGGSGYGISQVINGLTDIGMASKNPFSNALKSKDIWINKKIKTITLGWESLCFVYIPPVGLSNYDPDYLNSLLTIVDINKDVSSLSENDPSILNLYYAFSGWGYQCYNLGHIKKEPYKLSTFIDKNKNIDQNDLSLLEKTDILPYARSGGALTSGTASAFYECSHFTNFENDKENNLLNAKQIAAFKTGQYGKDFHVYDTDEANSRSWDVFSKNNIPGSLIYLSSGFIQENYDLIVSKHYGIMTYNHIKFSIDNVGNGYNFFRPINIIVSLENNDSFNEIKRFATWLIFESQVEQWKKMGLKKVNDHQIQSMCSEQFKLSGPLYLLFYEFLSDNQLMTERSDAWDKKQTILGAIE